MLSLSIKDIREVFSDTLFKFYSLSDFSISSTKVKDKDKEFRIEFRIYDTEFWMDIDPSIDSIRIGTRSLGGPDRLDTIQMWLSKPFEYDKKFEFGWRKDLECFFDAFHTALLEKLAKTQKANMAAVYGLSTKAADETKKTESSIFNNLKDEEGKAGAAVLSAILDGLDAKSKALKDAEAKETKTSIFNGLDDQEDRDEYI